MTGNKTLDFIIALLACAGFLWWAWSEWKGRQHAKQLSKQRAEAIASGEWGDRAPDIWMARKLGPSLGKAWAAWVAYRESFVFAEELGGWPVVRRIAPDVLLMKAPYIGPRRVQDFSGFKPPALTGLAVGALYWFGYRHIATPEALWQNSITVGVIFGAASYPLWKLARKTRLSIRFDRDGISWKGPDRRKQRVKLEHIHSLEAIPHRWAHEERRKHDNWMRSHPGQSAPVPLFQTASELILHTGPEGRNWLAVAEFCDDLSREHAAGLMTAIAFVAKEAAQEEAERRKKVAEAGPL
jgi:hypothetical protein